MKKAIILCLLSFLALNWTQSQLKQEQAQKKELQAAQELPPSIALINTTLGPIKGIAANALMWRATELEEEQEFMESGQIAKMVSQLHPNSPSIWRYQAFNLSFNISGRFTLPEEKWPWILEGINLLRKEGLRYNPGDRSLELELMRTLIDKIDGTESQAIYMQNQWTIEMIKYFNRGNLAELKELRNAPKTKADLLQDSNFKLLHKIAQERQLNLFDFKNLPPQNSRIYLRYILGSDASKEQESALLTACSKLSNFYQRQLIQKETAIDFDRAIQIDEKHGPFDWRSHQAWAVYYGASDDPNEMKSNGIDFKPYLRQSLYSSFYNGRIIYNRKKDTFIRSYNMPILAKLYSYFENQFRKDKGEKSRLSLKHFIQNAIVICFNANQIEAAEDLHFHYYDFGLHDKSPELSLEDFVLESMQISIKTSSGKESRAQIEALINRSFTSLDNLDYSRSRGYINRANAMWKSHQKKFGHTGLRLVPFQEIYSAAKKSWADQQGIKIKNLDDEIQKSIDLSKEKIPVHESGEQHKR